MTEAAPEGGSSGQNHEAHTNVEQVEVELHQRIERVAALLMETVDSLQQHPPDQKESAAREALVNLKPLLEEAIEALEDIKRHRDLTQEELSRRYSFKVLLAKTR